MLWWVCLPVETEVLIPTSRSVLPMSLDQCKLHLPNNPDHRFPVPSHRIVHSRIYKSLCDLLSLASTPSSFSFSKPDNLDSVGGRYPKTTGGPVTASSLNWLPGNKSALLLLGLNLDSFFSLGDRLCCPTDLLDLDTQFTTSTANYSHDQSHFANMSRIQIPLDALTSRLNLGDRFSSLRSTSMSNRFANLRPVSEFLDIKRVSKPANFAEAQSRVNYNLGHFSSNYAVIFVMLCIYALLTNPWLLFDIVFVVAGMYLIGRLNGADLEIGQTRITTSQLYTGLYVIAIPVGLISSPISTIMWLIGASGVVILGHAAMMDKPLEEAFSGEAV